ncbi:YhdP family protein [Dokdonella sp.]|uniref:YhdP family protein n=1 Tax=Dokdonella sp. TaxID=2291710 RepID=UPI00321F908A
MNTRRRLRRLRFAVVGTLAGLVILVAIMVGVMRLALPWLAHNPERVAAWLSARLDRPVTLAHVEEHWTHAGPRLALNGLVIGAGRAGESEILLPRAELALNLYAPFQRNRAWNEFRLIGLDLALERGSDGAWSVSGLAAPREGADDNLSMGVLGAIVLVDFKLVVRDPARALDARFEIPELRVVNLGRMTRVLGRIGRAGATSPPFALVSDFDLEAKSGSAWLGGSGVDLAEVGREHGVAGLALPAGQGDIEIWLDWKASVVDDVRARIDLRDATLAATTAVAAAPGVDVEPRALFDRLAFVARWQRNADGWTFDLADGRFSRRGIETEGLRVQAVQSGGEAAREWRFAASAVPIEPLGSFAMLPAAVPAKLREWLYAANPGGQITTFEGRWRAPDDFAIDARVEGFAAEDARVIPGVDHLDFHLRGDAAGLLLELPRQAARFDYPYAFPTPFDFSAIEGDIIAWPDADGWHLRTPQVAIESARYAIDLRGGLHFADDGSRPLLDVQALVPHAEVPSAKGFWPIRVMPPPARAWLDRALVDGRVREGRVVFRGDLDDWPFEKPTGRFEAKADLTDLLLDFLPGWPRAERIDLVARFINAGMLATVSAGQSKALVIDRAEASIARFGDAVLDLKVQAHGPGPVLIDYLRATPIGATYVDALRGLSVGGQGKVGFTLRVPFADVDTLTLDGGADLVDADLGESTWALEFAKASGRVAFSQDSVHAEKLAVQVDGHAAELALAIGSATKDRDNVLEAALDAALPVATVFARVPELAPAFVRFPGQAQWQARLAVGAERGAAPSRRQLDLSSDLRGIAIDLPAPLAKAAADVRPFSLSLDIPPLDRPFTASLGNLHVRGRIPGPTSTLAVRADFGDARNSVVPDHGIAIGGLVAELDLGGWMDLARAGASGDSSLRGVDLEVGTLILGGRDLGSTRLAIESGDDAMHVRFSGAAIDGTVRVPSADLARSGITAELKHLHWPDPPPGQENAPGALSGVAPSSLPPLHLWVGELRLGAANLGEARFESRPSQDGMHIDLLETASAALDMRARGEWTGAASDSRSHLVIDMTAQSLGRMLDAFGFAGIIDGGKTLARIDAQWPGAPAAFALANLDGTLELSVDKGRILEVNPGAGGRLFGLLSLTEIPRRLSLDFSDLFRSGMSFNEIKGRFVLRDGNAFTEGLHIDSPAASIDITGRTGLRARDYDQQMVVTPRAGATLPVVGAIAGGPVGAAAGLVVQGLIGKQINEVAQSRYRVGGSWDKPDITLLARERTPATKRGAGEVSGPQP